MHKVFLRIGFLGIIFNLIIYMITYVVFGFNVDEYLSTIFNNSIMYFIISFIFILFLNLVILYFIYKCIIHFWRKKYSKFLKILIILLSVILYSLPMLLYYIAHQELED